MCRTLLLFLALLASPAWAHKASDSLLSLDVQNARIEGRWDIALRDLEEAIGLDANQDGRLSWGEVRGRASAIDAYALSRLNLSAHGVRCPLSVQGLQLANHVDGTYVVLPLAGECPRGSADLALDYRLLFDIDRQHRGLAELRVDGVLHPLVFGPESATQRITGRSAFDVLVDFIRQGVLHIWTGYDHILFLVSLLLPAVLVWQGSTWRSETRLANAVADVAKTVTAFTFAHSLTLAPAALGWISLPSRLVESAIAVSVICAALNNLRPFLGPRRWVAAFGFGLIHGFGFASVLAEVGLPGGQIALALFGFNFGVELGQLAIVALVLPAAFALRGRPLYRRGLLPAGSIAITLFASNWLLQRALDVSLW
ncbi:HupE/UreJ family protein [Niveibacterium sp. SC-1]|uniref:HupE/UreJ family protein n=1 Tax=Niveibacterium sp. SC-1 TaxID=3135646 RepID=UPI00311F1E63